MPAPDLTRAVLRLRERVRPPDGADRTDGQLLDAFRAGRCEESFALLVRRHGPTVLGVCRRVLGHSHDAEDAFQATFLVLARRAHTLRRRESVAAWLYGVALRTARKARTLAARRRLKEGELRALLRPEVAAAADDGDWKPLLDRELARLPEKYRLPVLLCDLAGRPRRDAARQLRIPEGTLSSRLARAHVLLRDRLVRAGVTLSTAALAEALTERMAAAVPAGWVETAAKLALKTAGASAAPGVVVLTEGVIQAMWWNKLKLTAVATVSAALLAGASGAVMQTGRAPANESPTDPFAAPVVRDGQAPTAGRPTGLRDRLQGIWQLERLEQYGKPMPIPAGQHEIEFTGDRYTSRYRPPGAKPDVTAEGRFRLDESVSPPRLSILLDHPPEERTTTFRLSFSGDELVMEFESDAAQTGNAKKFLRRVTPAAQAGDASERDRAAIQGVWSVVSKEADGQSMPVDRKYRFEGDTMTGFTFSNGAGSITPHGRFRLDAGRTPRTIDLIDEGHSAPTVRGIYLLEGDTLLLCFGSQPDHRPTSFTARAGSKQLLLVLRREPEEKSAGLGPQERQRLQTEEAELQKRRADLDAQIRKLEEDLDRTRRRLREVRDQLDRPAAPKQ